MLNKSALKAVFFLLLVMMTGSCFSAVKKKTKTKEQNEKTEKKSQVSKMPDWVSNPNSVYSRDLYVTYVGSAPDKNDAELKAVEGIASFFGQSVTSTTNASVRMKQAKDDGFIASASANAFSQTTMRSVDADNLIGVEVPEFWFDGSSWHALAVLDKLKAIKIYSDMIEKNAKALATILENNKDEESFECCAAFDFAADIALENELYLNRVSVIDLSYMEQLKRFCPSSKEYRERRNSLARNMQIGIVVENDEQGRFQAAFEESVNKAGFKAVFGKKSRYVVVIIMHFNRSDTSDGKAIRCRYNCESYILDNKKNERIVPFTFSGREAHKNSYDEAKYWAVRKIETRIKNEFGPSLSNYLNNLMIR